MQLASRAPAAPKQKRMGRPNLASLGRSLRYLSRYPRLTFGATLSLIIATAAQLVVPQLVQRIIDTIVSNATNQGVLSLPANIQTMAAQQLGLDLAAYDAAVADPATEARIEKDRQDGLALGVQGTPTFFLDGTMINPTSEEELRAALDAAVAK